MEFCHEFYSIHKQEWKDKMHNYIFDRIDSPKVIMFQNVIEIDKCFIITIETKTIQKVNLI